MLTVVWTPSLEPRLERLNLRRLIEIEIEIENSNLQMEMRLTPEMSIILEMSIISELGLATLYTGSSSELAPHEQAQGHLGFPRSKFLRTPSSRKCILE